MVHHDAEVRDWVICRIDGFVVLVGRISADKKRRFPDGRLVRTSPLLTLARAKEGDVVATFNSHYLLVGPQLNLDHFEAEDDARLNQTQSIEFAEMLANPPRPNKALQKLWRSTAPWARD